jgi:hypothetical protein
MPIEVTTSIAERDLRFFRFGHPPGFFESLVNWLMWGVSSVLDN